MVRTKLFYRVALGTSLALYGTAFFWLTDGWVAGLLGLLLLPAIIWAADALGLIERFRDQPTTKRHGPRQYTMLRSKVGLLLDIVRRMNWLAVDMDRRVRSVDEVEGELDLAVLRMKELVDEIRQVAGRSSEDSDALDSADQKPDD